MFPITATIPTIGTGQYGGMSTKTSAIRFFSAVRQLEQLGYLAEAYDLEGIYRRSLADEREPLNVAAVGSALAILNRINGADARDARDALAELLMKTERRAA